MEIITRKEYDCALNIVEKYHKQILSDAIKVDPIVGKTLFKKWDKYRECPERVKTVLRFLMDKNTREEIIYVEDVTKEVFLEQRNAGIKSWKQFEEIRGY